MTMRFRLVNEANMLKILGEPTRLQLALFVTHNEGCIQKDILNKFNYTSQANIAFHLKELINGGILDTERNGRFVKYYIADDFFLINLLNLLRNQ